MNARDLQRVGAVLQPVAEFRFPKKTLPRVTGRGQAQIGIGCQDDEIGNGRLEAQLLAVAKGRRKEAGLAAHGRIGGREDGQARQRYAEKLEARIFKPDGLLLAVPDDLLCLDLPEHRAVGVFLAGFASGIEAIVEDRQIAVTTLAALGTKTRIVRCHRTQSVDKAVREIVRYVDFVRGDPRAVRLQNFNIADGDEPRRALVVGHTLCDNAVAVIVDPHIADGGHGFIVVVVDQFVGLQQQLRIGIGLDKPRQILRQCRSAKRRDAQAHAHGDRGQQTAMSTEHSHQPSSRYRRKVTPNMPAATTGSHAASRVETIPAFPNDLATDVTT